MIIPTINLLLIAHDQTHITFCNNFSYLNPMYIVVDGVSDHLEYSTNNTTPLPHARWTDDGYETLWQLPLISDGPTLFLDLREIANLKTIARLVNHITNSDLVTFGQLLSPDVSNFQNYHIPLVNTKQILFNGSSKSCQQYFDTLKQVGRNWREISESLLPVSLRQRDDDLIAGVTGLIASETISPLRILNFTPTCASTYNGGVLISNNSVTPPPVVSHVRNN